MIFEDVHDDGDGGVGRQQRRPGEADTHEDGQHQHASADDLVLPRAADLGGITVTFPEAELRKSRPGLFD